MWTGERVRVYKCGYEYSNKRHLYPSSYVGWAFVGECVDRLHRLHTVYSRNRKEQTARKRERRKRSGQTKLVKCKKQHIYQSISQLVN